MVELCRFAHYLNQGSVDFYHRSVVGAESMLAFSPSNGELQGFYMSDQASGFAHKFNKHSRPKSNTPAIFRVINDLKTEYQRFHSYLLLFYSQSAPRFKTAGRLSKLSGERFAGRLFKSFCEEICFGTQFLLHSGG
jgi:hypothetical protein